jgi:hypothetical protein
VTSFSKSSTDDVTKYVIEDLLQLLE